MCTRQSCDHFSASNLAISATHAPTAVCSLRIAVPGPGFSAAGDQWQHSGIPNKCNFFMYISRPIHSQKR
jgi:hypothetical protein